MAAVLATAAIGAWGIKTEQLSYVVTHGISMQPTYHAGDLVILLKFDSYEVGQIAAYDGTDGVEVLHRIIGGSADTGFVLQGDNNKSIDHAQPKSDELIGRAVLHIPKAGTWIQPLLSPTGLGMLGFLFVSGGAARAKSRRDILRGRSRKRVKGMSGGGGSWATAAAVFKAVSRLHPALRVLAAVTVVCGVLGLALGSLGWIKPVTEIVTGTGRPGESMTFAYSAEVPHSAAYDGTTVYSPDPVFRKLAGLIDLHLNYRGEAGRIEVTGRLAAQNGWHKTLQLSQPQQFMTDRYTGTVQINLEAIDQRIAAAGTAIGADMTGTTLAITARVEHNDGTVFEPQISLNVSPLLLTLTSGPQSLVVDQSSASVGSRIQDRQIGAFGYDLVTAASARKYAVYLILAALAGAGIVAWMALGHVPLRTRTQIQRRYPHLIVPVEPMASPPGKPVVVVDTFPALVKLAEKYGQLILTWTRPDGADDFVVRDEGILYRYRIEPNLVPVVPAKVERQPAASSPSGRVAPGAGTVPPLQLPPVPETPPELQADLREAEDPARLEGAPVNKTAPRKRASRTAAAKAAAKTTATKAAPTKRAPAKAPAKRTRAQAKTPSAPAPEAAMTAASEIAFSPDEPTQSAFDAGGLEAGGPDVTTDAAQSPGTGVTAEAIVEAMDLQPERVPTDEASASTPLPGSTTDKSGTSLAAEPELKTSPESTSDSGQPEQDPAALAIPPETHIPEDTSSAHPEGLKVEADLLPFERGQVTAGTEDPDRDAAETEHPVAQAKVITPSPGAEAAEPVGHAAKPEHSTTGPKAQTAAPGQSTVEPDATALGPGRPTTESESTVAEPAPTEPAGPEGIEPEPAPEAIRLEPSAMTETTQAESTTAPETARPEATDSRPSRSQQRTSRRKGRSRRSPQPAMDEPPTADRPASADEPVEQPTAVIPDAPANEAREAMKDLADRNRPITTPEPEPEAQPEPKREPIYDFLPAAKRAPSPPDPEDEPEA
ncbi:hypothetical protein Q0Z83_081550 [Actinoplanes sichuanensis]|uniref:DUF5305 family protein n=1 Tax=Actinoplanes sichuanensis TaxID=512349 RepID=A0ABW4ADA8_9ACTN|nr:DUF5305 family protein [Actinoplanes sichuanensis]BEL09964.1 hypothetical protein Q0Z83_081550 [Actinoplanes sichuanensis]